MPTSRTVPVTKKTRNQRALLLGIGFACCFAYAVTSAADVLVITDRRHPIKARSTVRVIELDAAERLVDSQLEAHLPADPGQAATIAQQRLKNGGAALQKRLALAYQSVVEVWSLGVTKIPAIVVDRRYVVYGEADVERAVSLIEQYRSTNP